MLGSIFHSRAEKKGLITPFTSLARTSSVGGIQDMQGGDQPATGMEPDLEWASCSRVSKFSQGQTHTFCGR